MRKALSALRGVAGVGALVLGAGAVLYATYFAISSMPDLKRYIRISTM